MSSLTEQDRRRPPQCPPVNRRMAVALEFFLHGAERLKHLISEGLFKSSLLFIEKGRIGYGLDPENGQRQTDGICRSYMYLHPPDNTPRHSLASHPDD